MVNTISKPFTFYSNTYAKASEVNADFDELYKGTNACINQTNSNTVAIEQVSGNKASINGDASQVFNVADATANTHAVNLETLKELSDNSRRYIYGYRISRSGTNTFSVTSGSCFDVNRNVLIYKSSTTSDITNTGQVANTIYYVFVQSDSNGNNISFVTSTSSSYTPPSGYVCRMIGYFTTGSSNSINSASVISYGDITTQKQGSWVVDKSSTLFNSTAIGTYTFSLKDYLPKDGGVYEVIFQAYGGTTANSTAHLYWDTILSSNNVGFLALWDKQGSSADGGYGTNVFMLPCRASTSGSNVNIQVRVTGAAWGSVAVSALAYRKVY